MPTSLSACAAMRAPGSSCFTVWCWGNSSQTISPGAGAWAQAEKQTAKRNRLRMRGKVLPMFLAVIITVALAQTPGKVQIIKGGTKKKRPPVSAPADTSQQDALAAKEKALADREKELEAKTKELEAKHKELAAKDQDLAERE